MKKSGIIKVLRAKDKLENQIVDKGFDVGDYNFDEWVEMVNKEINKKGKKND